MKKFTRERNYPNNGDLSRRNSELYAAPRVKAKKKDKVHNVRRHSTERSCTLVI